MDDQVLIHGDCLEEMPNLSPQSIDLVLADIPYGTTSCSWDIVIPFDKMWGNLKTLTKETTPIILFGSQPFTSLLVTSNLKMFKYEIIWIKNYGSNFAVARKQPFKEHENILVFYKKQPYYAPIMEERSEAGKAFVKGNTYKERKSEHTSDMVSAKANRDPLLRLPSSIKKFKKEVGLHPTQKPVELLEYLIKTYTKEGDTVLDFTMGSGSTGEACFNTNRKFIGIEKDEKYFKIAYERLTKPKAKPLFRA